MAKQKIVRAIQKVKQEDGTQLPVFPINTSDDVYTDIANKKTLKQELDEIVYKKNTVTANNSSVTTFRDPILYIGDKGITNGDMNIKLPVTGTIDGTSVSIDMSIAGCDHVSIDASTSHNIDSFPGMPGNQGEIKTLCSDMSRLGNVLIVSALGSTSGVKAYKVNDNSLQSIDISLPASVDDLQMQYCSVSEDGTFLVLMDDSYSTLHTFYRLNDNLYYHCGSIDIDGSDLSCIKVTDPTRNMSGMNNSASRTAVVIICPWGEIPYACTFSAFSAPVRNNSILNITESVSDVIVNNSGSTLFCRVSNASSAVVTYTYNSLTGAYAKDKTVNYGTTLQDISLSPSETNIGCVVNTSVARIYPITNGTFSTTPIKDISAPTGIVFEKCTMLTDKKICFWGYETSKPSIGKIALYDMDIDAWVDTANLSQYITETPDNIFSSANRKYGFIIKANNSTDNSPLILPFEQSATDIRVSTGTNELDLLPTRFITMSKDGQYIAMLPKTATGVTALKIFKEINNSYIELASQDLTQISESDVVGLTCTYSGDTFVVLTSSSVYVYRRDMLDGISVKRASTGDGVNTCVAISESHNGFYALLVGKKISPFILSYVVSLPSDGFTVGRYSEPTYISNAIATEVIGISTYDAHSAYVATLDEANSEKYNISSYTIGGSALLSDKQIMNASTLDGKNAKISFSISGNGEYVGAVDTTNNIATFYCRNGSANFVRMGFVIGTDYTFTSHDSLTDVRDISFDNAGRFLYAVYDDNSIKCYDIKNYDNTSRLLTELTTYHDESMIGLNKINVADSNSSSRLFVNGYSFPYSYIFDIDIVSGFADINLSGTILSENRTDSAGIPYSPTLWKNTTLTHNNPKLIKNIIVGTDPADGCGLISIKSFDEKWLSQSIQINRFTIYGELDNNINYTDIIVSVYFSNQGNMSNIQTVQNNIGIYKDMNIIGTGTINGDQIVGVTRLKNITILKELWIDEKSSADSGYYRYRITDRHISTDSMVNIDIKTPADLTVAAAAGIQSVTVEGDGYVDIYATNIPTANIVVDVNIFR